jgi:formate dehydrogenase subunit gamma
MDWIGRETYASVAHWTKLLHDNVAWAFMVALVLIFVFWVAHNLPSRTDLTWIRYGGGLLGGSTHPPAKKFNLGQKLIFWSVIILGVSISASGLSLLFPYDLPMFAKTFAILNDVGVPGWFGQAPYPTALVPQEEMQFAQLWHSIVAFVLIAIIIAHIYIGTIGMEGAFSAMGSGRVDANWAREHHSIWAEKKIAEGEAEQQPATAARATPAE